MEVEHLTVPPLGADAHLVVAASQRILLSGMTFTAAGTDRLVDVRANRFARALACRSVKRFHQYVIELIAADGLVLSRTASASPGTAPPRCA